MAKVGQNWWPNSNLCTTDNGYSFYSPAGKLLGTYTIAFTPYYYVQGNDGYQLIPDSLTITNGTPLAYFGSRRLWVPDRVGSQGRFFPYGEDRTGMNYPQSGQYAFATYLDNGSGVYYADQRWYAAAPGRFLSPDPYKDSGGPADPQSWNKFAYTENDPINFFDPVGLEMSSSDGGLPPDSGGPSLSSLCLASVQSKYQEYLAEMGLQEAPNPFGGSGYGAAQNACLQLVGYAPAPPQPAPAPPPPPCFIELKYRSVPGTLNNHAYLWVETATGLVAAIEGFPDRPSLMNAGYLRAWTSPNGRLGTNAAANSEWGPRLDAGDDPNVCSQASNLFALANQYDSDPVLYYAIGGPNSNSLAHWFVMNDGLGSYFTSPPPSTSGPGGWYTPIYP